MFETNKTFLFQVFFKHESAFFLLLLAQCNLSHVIPLSFVCPLPNVQLLINLQNFVYCGTVLPQVVKR